MTLLATAPPAQQLLTAQDAENVTNHFTLPGSGMEPDKLYSNTTGQVAAAQAFATSGLIPLTAAMIANGFTYSLDGTRPNWLTNGARINFYSSSNPVGSFISSVTSGVTASGDLRTLACVPGSIPGGATHFATNLKYATGIPSLVYSASNVIPAGAMEELAEGVMVNSGLTGACLTAYGAAGTVEAASDAVSFEPGEFLVCNQGYASYIRKPWKTGKHLVQKVSTSPEGRDFNNTYQFNSVVEITDTTFAPLTPGAWAAGFSATGASATTAAVWSDCHPAYRLNGMYMGGLHGIVSSFCTASAHGKTNADRGSIWNVGGTNMMLTGRYDANRVFLTHLNTGGDTDWSISSTLAPTGTATHVSGATNTADITITSRVLAYLNPATQIISDKVWLEGARALTTDGAYYAKLRIQDFSYRVPNAGATLDYVAANLGSTDDLDYNDPAIDMQLQIDLRWLDDAWATTVFHQVTALQEHFCNFSWPFQWQRINARTSAGETLHYLVPASKSLQAGVTHTGGSARNFSSWQDITSLSLEYYWDAASWADASFWSDNIQRPAWVSAYGVKDSGGNWLRKFAMARSLIAGWTATGTPDVSLFLSANGKSYGVTRYEEAVTEGDARMVVAGQGWIDPADDPEADVSLAFPLGGGVYEWQWWSADVVTDYDVPIPGGVEGKHLELVCRAAGCSVTINPDNSLTVTTTGAGLGFCIKAQSA